MSEHDRKLPEDTVQAKFEEIMTAVMRYGSACRDRGANAVASASARLLEVESEAYTKAFELVKFALARAEQSNSLPPEIGALIDEALTFSHQDCGARDEDGYGCIRCAAENADMRRRSNENFRQTVQAFDPTKGEIT